MTVTTRTRRRGEHGISRKTIARGMPGLFRCTCGDYARVLLLHCTRGYGCIGHPAFPAPSDLLGGQFLQNLGRSAPRERERAPEIVWLFENRINLVVPDKRAPRARSGTHNHQCSLLAKLGPQRTYQQALVVMGPRSRAQLRTRRG